ncbi:MAG: hypothetical protein U5R49_04595 [Deltaproteobacteria bacterium]|nr:hypothetical protein [Deltaproteobacteria bacterium]
MRRPIAERPVHQGQTPMKSDRLQGPKIVRMEKAQEDPWDGRPRDPQKEPETLTPRMREHLPVSEVVGRLAKIRIYMSPTFPFGNGYEDHVFAKEEPGIPDQESLSYAHFQPYREIVLS